MTQSVTLWYYNSSGAEMTLHLVMLLNCGLSLNRGKTNKPRAQLQNMTLCMFLILYHGWVCTKNKGQMLLTCYSSLLGTVNATPSDSSRWCRCGEGVDEVLKSFNITVIVCIAIV